MRFEWDPVKAAENLAKHGVSFHEATTAFGDPLETTAADLGHSLYEERFVTFGLSTRGRLLGVAHTEHRDTIRIMKAEYRRSDLGPLVRGKYTQRYRESSNVVVIEPDLARAFPNARAVNTALRRLLRARKASAPKPGKAPA